MSDLPTYATALGRIPSGLFVLTARRQHDETALLVSWVQQCSFAPPRLTVAIRQDRPVLSWLEAQALFVLNILAEGNRELVIRFGKGPTPAEAAFAGLAILRDSTLPAPVLCDAHAYLVCRTVTHWPAGDHVLVLADVIDGNVLHEGRPTVHIRKNGLNY
jgi:flavin reductase (DIM6/NTAB) family NADH-FMN oxidoreductase RutF